MEKIEIMKFNASDARILFSKKEDYTVEINKILECIKENSKNSLSCNYGTSQKLDEFIIDIITGRGFIITLDVFNLNEDPIVENRHRFKYKISWFFRDDK